MSAGKTKARSRVRTWGAATRDVTLAWHRPAMDTCDQSPDQQEIMALRATVARMERERIELREALRSALDAWDSVPGVNHASVAAARSRWGL